MKCPHCQSDSTKVSDSRLKSDRRFRKRQCGACGHRFSTTEVIGEVATDLPLLPQMVQKKSGKQERFDRSKLLQSIAVAVRKARRGQVPISEIVDGIERDANPVPGEPLPTTVIGNQVLQALLQHDRLAYVRYLSVHQKMETRQEIQTLIDELQQLLASTPPDEEKESE